MADTLTAFLDMTLPQIGGSSDTWGTKLNENFTKIDVNAVITNRNSIVIFETEAELQAWTLANQGNDEQLFIGRLAYVDEDGFTVAWFPGHANPYPEYNDWFILNGLADDGFEALPGVRFWSDLSSGLFWNQTSQYMGVSIGAVRRMYISASSCNIDVPTHFTGNVTIKNTGPTITLNDSDATVGGNSSARLNLQAAGAAAGFFGMNGNQLSMNSNRANIGFSADADNLVANTTIFFNIDGVLVGRLDPAAVATAAQSIMTRALSDTRYPQLAAANTFTGNTTLFAATAPIVSLRSNNPVAGASQTAHMALEAAGGIRTGLVGFSGGSGLLVRAEIGGVQIQADATNTQANTTIQYLIDGVLVGRMDPAGAIPVATSVINRAAGDGRYTQIASDARMKNSIENMLPALSKILALRPVTFEWNASEDDPRPEGRQSGLIAQEVASVLPSAVIGSEDTAFGIDALTMIGVLVQAVQDLSAKVDTLEAMLLA